MSFSPARMGPVAPMGLITIAAAGTGSPLDENWDPKYGIDAVTEANPHQFSVVCNDVIISSPPGNAGGIWVVKKGAAAPLFSKDNLETVICYIPNGSGPVSLATLGFKDIQPGMVGVDVDQNGDSIIAAGIIR